MVRRAGIGATLASSMIFSIILISNFAVYYGSAGRASSYTQANIEDSFYDQGVVMEGTAAINTLSRLQSFLGANPLDCRSASSDAAVEIQSLSESDRVGSLDSQMVARLVEFGPRSDNLSIVAPFGGTPNGAIDLALTFQIEGESPDYGVSYLKNETHFVNLPVRLAEIAGDCLAAVSEVGASLSSMPVTNCTESVIAPLVEAAEQGPKLRASSDGFSLGVSFQILGTAACTTLFEVTVLQQGIAGPAGPFTVALRDWGIATFEQPPVQAGA